MNFVEYTYPVVLTVCREVCSVEGSARRIQNTQIARIAPQTQAFVGLGFRGLIIAFLNNTFLFGTVNEFLEPHA